MTNVNSIQNSNVDAKNRHPDVHKETIYCTFNQYHENGFELFLYFFRKTTNGGEHLKVKEVINFKFFEFLEREGLYDSEQKTIAGRFFMKIAIKKGTFFNVPSHSII